MVFGFCLAYAMGVKNIPVRSLQKSQCVMDHCSSPLEPACPPQAGSEGRGSTHVCFSRGGGVSHRIAGQKSHWKKSKPAGFPMGVPLAWTLFPDEKCQRDK